MPPKKSAPTDNNTTSGKFSWEGANDLKLLLLTQGRWVKTDEYEQLSSAFPGTTTGSIRNRISALRVKQRDMYEEAGWELPEGGATKKTGTPAKRKKGEEGEGEQGTLSKKGRGKGKKKGGESEGEGEGEGGEVKGVKQEEVDEA